MLPSLDDPELLFGICSPVGTRHSKIKIILTNALLQYHYNSIPIKVTELMKEVKIKGFDLIDTPFDARYDTYIKYANQMRQLFGHPSVLAMLCCARIRGIRRSNGGPSDEYIPKTAYIFDQFKRTEEISLLRQVYGRLFVLISVYSDKEIRLEYIQNRIASDKGRSKPSPDDAVSALELMARDEAEEDIPNGQRLRDTFAMADLFINIDDPEGSERLVHRFLKGLFGSNEISPTRDEYGMYAAKGASIRSADLSRQVGAAIFTRDTEVVTLGSNEVPKSSGGTYWTGEADHRDMVLGRDENERIKRSLLVDVVQRLREGSQLNTNKTDQQLVDYILQESTTKGTLLRQSQVMDLLEFGRIIHAEMSAICDAARLGKPVKGSTLYCTTFPCHICAKHIIASGVARVVYIEPYAKSYAEHLHSDAIQVGVGQGDGSKVVFSPFIGISPFRYRELFERSKRKDNFGEFSDWSEGKPKPTVKYTVAAWLMNETAIIRIFQDIWLTLRKNDLIT